MQIQMWNRLPTSLDLGLPGMELRQVECNSQAPGPSTKKPPEGGFLSSPLREPAGNTRLSGWQTQYEISLAGCLPRP